MASPTSDPPKTTLALVPSQTQKEPGHTIFLIPLTPLVGRRIEINFVVSRIIDPSVRLVTLTGPGGVGKTRLALSAASTLQQLRFGRIAFDDLSPIRDSSFVLSTVGRLLELRETDDQAIIRQIGRSFEDRQLVLILDNCEHVISAAPQIAELLVDCPTVKALATSRAPLNITSEEVFVVPPLTLPPLDKLLSPDDLRSAGATQLFIQRARASNPHFGV